MSKQEQTDNWLLHDKDRDNMQIAESRSEAEDRKEKMEELGANVAIHQPGEHPNTQTASYGGTNGEVKDTMEHPATEETNHSNEPDATEPPAPETPDTTAEVVDDMPETPPLEKDPVDWLPGHFIDEIQGVPTVNRKGYCVIAARYGVSVESHAVTLPSDTDFEYAEFKAVATTQDGETYSGFGSAHVDRQDGDEPYLLGELAETRAMKRAVAWATGIGMTAMSEMVNEI